MKTIKDLTPEIQAKIPKYIERAMEGVSDGNRYNNFSYEKACEAVYYNYEICGYKKPLVLVAENPYEMQLIFNFVRILMGDQKQLDSQLYSQLDSQLDSQLRSQLDSQLRSQLDSQLRSQLDSQLYSQLDSQLRSQLDSQLRSQKSELFRYHSQYLFTLNFYADCYYAWYEFIREEFKIKLSVNTMFQKIFNLHRESGISQAIFSEALCVICKYPKKVNWNSDNNMHNAFRNAVEWGYFSELTKFNCYYLNGRNMPDWIFEEKDKSTLFDKFMKENNEDVRAGIITMIKEKEGNEGLLKFLNAKLFDEKTINHNENYSEVIRLYKTKDKYSFLQDRNGNLNQPYCWSEIMCPSTGQTYLIDNSADFTDAIEAIKFLRPSFIPKETEYKWLQFAN